MTSQAQEFGTFKRYFWPVHNHELKKFLPMVLMFFCFLFNYTVMRNTKDTLVVTEVGAEIIPFLKLYGTLPMSVVFVLLYSKLSNVLKPQTLFYTMIVPFLVFFVSFGYIIYPNISAMEPTALVTGLKAAAQANLSEGSLQATALVFLNMIQKWPYIVFYVMAELWGSMGISLLFWQFANQICATHEAKRFYGGFSQWGNMALVTSGLLAIYFSRLTMNSPVGIDPWAAPMLWLMTSIGVCCLVIIGAYTYMQKAVVNNPALLDPNAPPKPKKKKAKLTMGESFKLLFSSKYLGCIALLVLCYGVAINLIEVAWKDQIKVLYPSKNEYQIFMGYVSIFTGIATLFCVSIGNTIIRKLGWKSAALSTPIMILITGGLFFVFIIFQNELGGFLPWSPVLVAVILGAVQNVLSKSVKYSLFDPTKEMTYIPLDQESKVKGKAAIDVVGGRLGKSGGSMVWQVLQLGFGSITNSLPAACIGVGVVVLAWIKSVTSLSKRYQVALSGDLDAATKGKASDLPLEAAIQQEEGTLCAKPATATSS